MAILLPEATQSSTESLTPRQIVAELDKYVIGQQSRHKDGRIFSAGETRFTEAEHFGAACAAEMVETLRLVH